MPDTEDDLRAALSEKSERFPNDQCPSCGFPKDGPEVDGYIGMKDRAEAAEREAQGLREECNRKSDHILNLNQQYAAQAQEIKTMREERRPEQGKCGCGADSGHEGDCRVPMVYVKASELAALTASLASMTKEMERQKSRADGEYQSALRYQRQRDESEGHSADAMNEVAELRKRIEKAVEALDRGCTCHGYECHCDSSNVTDARSILEAPALAPPPSPAPEAKDTWSGTGKPPAYLDGAMAPVESKPKEVA